MNWLKETAPTFKALTSSGRKLESEIDFEREVSGDRDDTPASIKEWLDSSDYELVDTPGKLDVKLTRKFRGEQYVSPPREHMPVWQMLCHHITDTCSP